MTRDDRRRSLLLAALAFAIVLIVWQMPDLNILLAPFRYFVTTIHELGHGLAALFTGGQFIHYEVYTSGAGVATSAGGWRWLVIPAGYLSTALFGAALLYFTNRTRFARAIATGLGIAFLILTVLFARNIPAILAGLVTGGALILLGRKAPLWLTTLSLNILAFLTALNAVLDLWGLLHSLNASVITTLGNVPNDAYAMAAEIPLLPAALWAVLWIIMALGLLGASLYWTFWRPVRDGEIL